MSVSINLISEVRSNDEQMLFTWDTRNLCIVFKSWRITGPLSLALSLVAIVLLCAGYEGVREISRRYEARHSAQMSAFSTSSSTFVPVSLWRIISLRLSKASRNRAHCLD